MSNNKKHDSAAKRAVITRRFYLFEEECIPMGPDVSIYRLRRLAKRIWRDNTNRRDRCPEIIAGNGTKQSGRWISYCEGRCKIVLARHERRTPVLIHEMVHALGPETHGKRFEKRYFALMDRYNV